MASSPVHGTGADVDGDVAVHGPLTSRLRPLFRAQRAIAGAFILAIVILVTIEVFLRSAFVYSLGFAHDVSGYLFVGASFLGFAVATADGRLFRIEFLIGNVSDTARRAMQFVFDLLSLTLTLIIDWHLVMFVISSFERDVREATALGTPLFVPQIMMPVGATLLAIVLAARLADTVIVALDATRRER